MSGCYQRGFRRARRATGDVRFPPWLGVVAVVVLGNQYGNGIGGGGWQPVVRRHGSREEWNRKADVTIHSIFVDNIPDSMGTRGLYTIFSNYGVVMDAFIPNKRRKMAQSHFGLVRYNCSVAADMAV
ncbi:hypothetical protein ACSBR1_035489 [Camellia fascicularis]